MLTPEIIKQIEQEAENFSEEKGEFIRNVQEYGTHSDIKFGYEAGATAFATKLSEQNNLLRDEISSNDTVIEGLGKSIKLKEEENKRLRKSLETMKSIIEQDLIANGNNDLGNRLHIEICVGLKTNTQ